MSDTEPQSSDPNLSAVTRAFVVYKRATGEVEHVHLSHTFAAAHQSSEEPSAQALRLVGKGEDVDVVEVDPAEVAGRRNLRIDVASRRLLHDDESKSAGS
jgi:hypothetical protein